MVESVVDILKGTLKCLVLVLYYWIVAVVKAVLPASVQAKDISGETVLITGAGSGIGRLMAVRFAKLKCRLVLWDVNEKGNMETLSMCKEYGVTVNAYTINLCERDDVYDIANKVKQEIGEIDILVNNAGIVTGKKFLDCPDNMIQKTMEVNAMAHIWTYGNDIDALSAFWSSIAGITKNIVVIFEYQTVKAFLPDMLKRNHGHIVSVASSAGFIGVSGLADYCASKFAAVGFEESLRFELASLGKDGIHTTVVCPFFINTGMFEGAKTRFPSILPVLEPDYVARKIVEAVLCNQTVLCIPRILYIFYAIKGLIPHEPSFVVSKYLGAHNLMDSFVGRQKIE